MTALGQRYPGQENIDGSDFSFEAYEECLHQISRLNALFGGFQLTFRGLALIDRRTDIFARCKREQRALRILDIGFGSGESMRRIHQWLYARDIRCKVTGIDIQPWCARIANKVTPDHQPIEFLIGDYRKLESTFDIVTSSLMTHHLSDDEIVELLRWMQSHAQIGWLINDLHRSRLAWLAIRAYTRAFRYGELVQHDAPVSVARSFRRKDWGSYLRRARVPTDGSRIFWHWGFRYGVAGWRG